MSALFGGSSQTLSITVDGDADKLLVLRVDGAERLSHLPQYTVDVVARHSMVTGSEHVDLHGMLGKQAHVMFDVQGSKRHVDGHVIRAQRGERHGRYDRYQLLVQPWLWFATRSRNSRVFQSQTVTAIIETVLEAYSSNYEWRLLHQADLPTLEYCVQYEESDFDFVSRLLEEYGIYYFFEHSATDHTLVMIDAMTLHEARESAAPVVWSNKFDGDHCMTEWRTTEEARAAKAVVRDYDYLASASEIEASHSGRSAGSLLGDGEIYQFPARVVLNQTVQSSASAASAANAAAKRLVETAQSMQKLHTGLCNAHDMVCGSTFTLSKSPRSSENGDYLIVGCDFRAEYGDHEAISDLKSIKRRRDGFEGQVLALDVRRGVFRPERMTPRPRMYGPQIATVVGAQGNEIDTDSLGRIKVQFPWDREGEKDENSSCWVRVAQPWAGSKMGLWMLPRVGHEVVVSFIGGDPDRPLVTGSVHNDANPPPYALPAHADVATWISHSTKEGADDAHNELRFCDTKDSEHVWFQAQKDFYRYVKGDTFDHLAMNETRKVAQTVKEVVGENWYLNVGKDVKHEFGKDVHHKVAGDLFTTGGATWQISLAKDYSLKVGEDASVDVTGKTAVKSGGDVNLEAGGAMNLKATGNLVGESNGKVSLKSSADLLMEAMNIKAKGSAEIVLEASAGIKIVCGPAVITLGPAGVTIDGPLVKVNCGGGGGSAGAAESAAAAEPKDAAEAQVMEELQPGQAEDYDKQLADPLAAADGTAGTGAPAMSSAAVDVPSAPDIPSVPTAPPLPPIPGGGAVGAAAAAAGAGAAGGVAGVGGVAMASVGAGMAAGVVMTVVDRQLQDPNSSLAKIVHAVEDAVSDVFEPIVQAVDNALDQATHAVEQGLDIAYDAVGQVLDVADDKVMQGLQAVDHSVQTALGAADAALGDVAEAAGLSLPATDDTPRNGGGNGGDEGDGGDAQAAAAAGDAPAASPEETPLATETKPATEGDPAGDPVPSPTPAEPAEPARDAAVTPGTPGTPDMAAPPSADESKSDPA